MAESSAKASPGPVKTVVFSLVPVAVLLVALEVGARVYLAYNPPLTVDIGQGFTGTAPLFIPDPDDRVYRITNPDKTMSFQEQRFRAEKPARTLRIAAIGGSSVNYLDYEFSVWPERLSPKLTDSMMSISSMEAGSRMAAIGSDSSPRRCSPTSRTC